MAVITRGSVVAASIRSGAPQRAQPLISMSETRRRRCAHVIWARVGVAPGSAPSRTGAGAGPGTTRRRWRAFADTCPLQLALQSCEVTLEVSRELIGNRLPFGRLCVAQHPDVAIDSLDEPLPSLVDLRICPNVEDALQRLLIDTSVLKPQVLHTRHEETVLVTFTPMHLNLRGFERDPYLGAKLLQQEVVATRECLLTQLVRFTNPTRQGTTRDPRLLSYP